MIRGLILGVTAIIVLAFASQDTIFNFLDLAGYLLLAAAVISLSTVHPAVRGANRPTDHPPVRHPDAGAPAPASTGGPCLAHAAPHRNPRNGRSPR